MTKENRSVHRVCPECENRPIMRRDSVFCDICNKYMDHTALVG